MPMFYRNENQGNTEGNKIDKAKAKASGNGRKRQNIDYGNKKTKLRKKSTKEER